MYFDPGAGSLIVQGMASLVAGFLLTSARIKGFLTGLWKRWK